MDNFKKCVHSKFKHTFSSYCNLYFSIHLRVVIPKIDFLMLKEASSQLCFSTGDESHYTTVTLLTEERCIINTNTPVLF
jgi:hypothetical protein